MEVSVDGEARRAPVERAVDRFAAIYTPAVIVMAMAVAVLPPLIWGLPFWGVQGWFYRALELLADMADCAQTFGRGDPGRNHGHLHRQNGHAHARSAAGCACAGANVPNQWCSPLRPVR